MTQSTTKKLGTSFHRTFALSRPGVTQVLRVAADASSTADDPGGRLTFRRLEEETTLGPVYIAAMRRYAFGTRLVDEAERLTTFGTSVVNHDSGLSRMATLWCLHFGLSVPYGPGPQFWGHIVATLLRPGDTLERHELADAIYTLANSAGDASVSKKTAEPAATIFLGTYSKSDALGPLGLLTEESQGVYRVHEPTPPPLWAFAYLLADYWANRWGAVTGVNLTQVGEEGGVGPILMMGGGLINRYLGELQREGVVVVQRRTPPFQLTRNWKSADELLGRLYD